MTMGTLDTVRLTLRAFAQRDLDDVLRWDPSLDPQAAQDFLDYAFREYRERNIGPWAMQRKDNNVIIGNCGFPHIDAKHRTGEINDYVATLYRGQGFATEALQALLEFGFADLMLDKIQGRCPPDNLASERVLQKIGMKFERLVKSPFPASQPDSEEKLYRILKKDFNARRPIWPAVGSTDQ